jgi:hypothetical protein
MMMRMMMKKKKKNLSCLWETWVCCCEWPSLLPSQLPLLTSAGEILWPRESKWKLS